MREEGEPPLDTAVYSRVISLPLPSMLFQRRYVLSSRKAVCAVVTEAGALIVGVAQQSQGAEHVRGISGASDYGAWKRL